MSLKGLEGHWVLSQEFLLVVVLLLLGPSEPLIRTQTKPGIADASTAPSPLRTLTKPAIFSIPTTPGNPNFPDLRDRTRALMQDFPLIDGHNDLPLVLRQFSQNGLQDTNLRNFTRGQTSLNRLKDGFVGAQFWSAYVPCQTQDRDALRLTLEQIDLIRRMCASYSELELVTSVQVKWTYSGCWGMVEVTTLAPENNHLTYAYSSEQHPEIGLPHWCGGWPFTRQ